MKLTTPENIQKRLQQGFDPAYHDRIYNQIRYAFGEPWRQSGSSRIMLDNDFPYYPDVTPKRLEVGRSRGILNGQFINLARTMYANPEPEFPELDHYTEEVRKQFWIKRAQGDGHADGDWATQLGQAFLDGDGVGTGFIQVGAVTNPKTGLQRTEIRHVPVVNCLWDRHVKTPARARWIAFVHHLALDVAEALYDKDLSNKVKVLTEDEAGAQLDIVRVIEYFDLGFGKGEPTMCTYIGSWNEKPLKVEENPYECLPFSFAEHVIPPGVNRPVGRIVLQMAIQEEINRIERRLSKVTRQPHVDLVDVDQVDTKDLTAFQKGEISTLKVKSASMDGRKAFERIPAPEASQTDIQRLAGLKQELNESAGLTDFDRGSDSGGARTATHDSILDQRSQSQGSWSRKQAAKLYIRTVEKVLYIAKMYDRDPVEIDIDGATVTINDPNEPRSWIANFLEEPSSVIVDEGALEYQDASSKQSMKLAQLEQFLPLVQLGAINPQKLAMEMLKAIGEKNPEGWIPQATPGMNPSMPQGNGMPGQGLPGQPPAGAPGQQLPQASIAGNMPPTPGEMPSAPSRMNEMMGIGQ